MLPINMINELTKDQEARLSEYRDYWLKVGLCTDRVLKEDAIKISHDIYGLLKYKKPLAVVLLPSPLASWLRVVMLSIDPSQVRSQVSPQVWSQVRSQVDSQVSSQVWSQVRSQVSSQVWSQVGSQVDSQVDSQVSSQVSSQVWPFIRPFIWPYLSGHYWSAYTGWATYFRDILKLKMPSGLDILEAHTQLGLVYPLEKFCVVSDRPSAIHMRSGVLHRDGGPAWEYTDGFCGWSLNGVRVTKEIAETPAGKIDPAILLKEKNAEVRREIVRKMGIERVCQKLGAKVLDKQDDYELLDINLGDGRSRPYLKMKNPSIATWHLEGVDPKIKTVKEALKWRNGLEIAPEILT